MPREPEHELPPNWSAIPDPWAELSSEAPPPPALPRALTRRDVRRRGLIAVALADVWAAVAILTCFSLRRDWEASAPFVTGQFVLWGGLALFTAALALASGRRGVGVSSARLRAVVVVTPLAFAAVAVLWTAPFASSWAIGDAGALAPCALLGTAVALPLTVLASWAAAHAFPSRAALRGATLGIATGLVGALALVVHCAHGAGGHVAVAHGVPLIVAGAVGAWLGRRVMRA